MGCQLHVPAALNPGKESLLPIGQEAGATPEPVWMRNRRDWTENFKQKPRRDCCDVEVDGRIILKSILQKQGQIGFN
jgi:hypothetical protein